MLTKKKVLKEIGCKFLDLELADGYVYFIFDDMSRNLYDTHSVWVNKLNHMDLDRWVSIGKEFAEKMEEKGKEVPLTSEEFNKAREEEDRSIYGLDEGE